LGTGNVTFCQETPKAHEGHVRIWEHLA